MSNVNLWIDLEERLAALDPGFTPENVDNKATDLSSDDNTHYPSTAAVNTALRAIMPYLLYTARLLPGDPPTVTELGTNTLGPITWSFSGTGKYNGEFDGELPADTWFSVTGGTNTDDSTIAYTTRLYRIDHHTIRLSVSRDGDNAIDTFEANLEIRVYT